MEGCIFFKKNWTCNSVSERIEEELICLVGCDALAVMKKVNLERHYTAFHWEQLFISKRK